MKNNLSFVVVAATLLMGCASPVYTEQSESVNLAKFKTYAWVDMKNNKDDAKNVTAFAEEAVHNTAKEELEKQGWKESTTNPDVLLSYDILVERTTTTQSQPVYTQPFTRVYFNPFLRRWATVYYPSQFVGYDTYDVPVREGTLTLTMTDTKTDKVVWQGWTTEQMDNQKMATKDVEKAVKNIIKKLGSQ